MYLLEYVLDVNLGYRGNIARRRRFRFVRAVARIGPGGLVSGDACAERRWGQIVRGGLKLRTGRRDDRFGLQTVSNIARCPSPAGSASDPRLRCRYRGVIMLAGTQNQFRLQHPASGPFFSSVCVCNIRHGPLARRPFDRDSGGSPGSEHRALLTSDDEPQRHGFFRAER